MVLKVGVIGCGNISETYFRNGPILKDLDYVACADLMPAASARRAEEFGIDAMEIDAMLACDDIDAVLNLTIPEVHADVSLQALEAGKHVYSEKPLALALGDGGRVLELAQSKGLRVGVAPDTFLGPAYQEARAQLDHGAIGEVVTGLATVLSMGMEDWHPNPGFFYRKGGGPVMDVGPYYIAALVHLLGPVQSVQASGRIGRRERLVTAEGPMQGKTVPVEVFTTVNALLTFAVGAEITFLASWDSANADLRPIELFGTGGSLRLPDPNRFAGDIVRLSLSGEVETTQTHSRPFGANNRQWGEDFFYNCYRGLGLADMARAIEENRAHRCSGEMALHVLDVMTAIETAAAERRSIPLNSNCERPAPLDIAEARLFLA